MKKQADRIEKADLTAARTLEELRRVSFSNAQDFFDEKGNLRPIQTLPPEVAACIASIEVVQQNIFPDDGKVDIVHKYKLWDKVRALEMLAKHFKLLRETVDVNLDTDIIARLHRGRERVRNLPPTSDYVKKASS